MTSVCVGGVASQVKTGLPDLIYIDTEFMASILPPQLVWLRPFLPYIPPIFIDLTPFCAGEPPTQPTLTDDIVNAVIAGGDLGAAVVAGNIIQAAILNWYWYQVCECTSGTQPTAPTPQADPGGLVAVNPPTLVTGPGATACATFTGTHAVDPTGSVGIALVGVAGAFSTSQQILPVGCTRVDIKYTNHASTSAQDEIGFGTSIWNAAGTLIASNGPTSVGQPAHGTNPRLVTVAIPAGAAYCQVVETPLFGSAPWTQVGTVDLSFYCGGATPGQPLTPCCPPDPVLSGMMQQILGYVKLIQRQAVPFGYIASTVHSALTGAGAFDIAGLIGVAVTVTTIPDSYGRRGSSPTEYFDLGFVTFGTPDGFPSSFRVEKSGNVMTPRLCSAYTTLDYDLAPGVEVTITELVREP